MGLQYSKYLSFDHFKKAQKASKCPQSAKKRTSLFKKKWLRKQSLKRLRPLRRLQQRQQKRKPKNNVFKNRNQQIKTSKILHATIFSTTKNLIHKRTDTMAEFILKNLFSILYKYVQI